MAAYDPATDKWRRLADAPEGTSDVFWTGEAGLTTVKILVDSTDQLSALEEVVRYDRSRDTWQPLGELAAGLIPVTDADGIVRAVLTLPGGEAGAPLVVLDRFGNRIGTLPGLPADPGDFGDPGSPLPPAIRGGVWAGEEALIWIESSRPSLSSPGVTELWALNPATEAWQQLGADDSPPTGDLQVVVDAGVLFSLGDVDEDAPFPDGVVYRAP